MYPEDGVETVWLDPNHDLDGWIEVQPATGPRVAQSWDSIPPVLHDGDEAISTRKLEKDYRDAMDKIERLEKRIACALDLQDANMPGFIADVLRGEPIESFPGMVRDVLNPKTEEKS